MVRRVKQSTAHHNNWALHIVHVKQAAWQVKGHRVPRRVKDETGFTSISRQTSEIPETLEE